MTGLRFTVLLTCLLATAALADPAPAPAPGGTPSDLDAVLNGPSVTPAGTPPAAAAPQGASVATTPADPAPSAAAATPVAVGPATPSSASNTHGQLEEIVVTATKRAAGVREIPASITALKGTDLEKRGYQSQEDFLKLVPGVTFYDDQINTNRITIRGIGADLGTSNTTGVFIGDVPFEDPTLPRVTLDPNLFDLARVEVLKGPQGTLFGGSALNGAVRYVPNDPLLGEWQEKAFYQYAGIQDGGRAPIYGGALNIPVGDSLAFRAVAFDRHSPGWVDDITRNIKDVNPTFQSGGRVMGLWKPFEHLKISAMGIEQRTFAVDTSLTDNRDGNQSRDDTPQASPTHSRYNLETVGIQYSFDDFDVLSQSSRTSKTFHTVQDTSRIANLATPPPPSVTTINDNHSQSLMEELRISSNEGFDPNWKWLAGAFYRHIHMTDLTNVLAAQAGAPLPPQIYGALAGTVPGLGGYVTANGQLNTAQGFVDPDLVSEQAVFGETTYTLFHSLDLTVGLRAFRSTAYARTLFAGVLVFNQVLDAASTQSQVIGDLVAKGIDPKFAAKYTLNRNVSFYASASKGFRFGGPQVLVGTVGSSAPAYYQSDTIWSYEVGVRTEWLQRTLTVDVTPYQIDWKNPQLQQSDSTGIGAFFSNVGGARARGVELAVAYLPPILRGLNLSFAGSYDSTVTTKPFTTSSGDMTQPGTRWPLSAKWQTATTLGYSHLLFGSDWKGGGSLVYTFISPAYDTLSYLDKVFGYQTLDAMLSLSNSYLPGRPELSLSLNNATNTHGIISGVNNPEFPKDHNYITPRNALVRIQLEF